MHKPPQWDHSHGRCNGASAHLSLLPLLLVGTAGEREGQNTLHNRTHVLLFSFKQRGTFPSFAVLFSGAKGLEQTMLEQIPEVAAKLRFEVCSSWQIRKFCTSTRSCQINFGGTYGILEEFYRMLTLKHMGIIWRPVIRRHLSRQSISCTGMLLNCLAVANA